MSSYYFYWGKSDKSNKYHLLAYHCLDVAAIADAYLNEHPELLEAMSKGFGLAVSVTKSLLLFFIALHDIGSKYSFNPVTLN